MIFHDSFPLTMVG